MIRTGYHGTDKESAKSVLKDGFRLSGAGEWLGDGVYLFESLRPLSDGFIEAKNWVTRIRPKDHWAVLEVRVDDINCFDVFENDEHRKKFEEIKTELFTAYQREKSPKRSFSDAIVFRYICDRLVVEMIRALVDGGKNPGYFTHIVKRPQVQLCLRNVARIERVSLMAEGLI